MTRLLTLVFCLKIALAAAQPPSKFFQFSPAATEAYHLATSLRFEEAKTKIAQLRASEPGNLLADFVENYVEFFRAFLDDDRAGYKRLLKKFDRRLDNIADGGDATSPYFLYTQAEIRLQSAILRGKFGDYLSAITATRKAYSQLEENREKFPDFVANLKSLGTLHALVGNVPGEYRWAVKFFGGMEGTIQTGLGEVEQVLAHARANPDFVFAEEAEVAYSFLLLHLGNQSEAAWQTLKTAHLHPRENPLAVFALANLAMKIGRNDEAIELLTACPMTAPYHVFHYRNFMLGLAKLQRLDADADSFFWTYVGQFPGQAGVKEAYQKLGWHYLILGDVAKYKVCLEQVKTAGSKRFEPDEAAQKEAERGEVPDLNLLKARLLFDGGYYKRAYDLVKNLGGTFPPNSKNDLEWRYRLGRIEHRLGLTDLAARHYGEAITAGAWQPYYFACNAALQLGLLYEEKRDTANARAAFKRCLALEPEEYSGSLHAKAKAGLHRVHR